VAVVLFSFLLFAGIGSAAAGRLNDAALRKLRNPVGAVMPAVALAIGLCALLCLGLLASLLQHALALPDAMRIVMAAALIAPLAFFMGMPFPLGLARVQAHDARLVPWAWAINGCASVMGAVLAALLAIHVGFTAVVVVALVLYGVAAAARP
jgi:hypothetical protein